MEQVFAPRQKEMCDVRFCERVFWNVKTQACVAIMRPGPPRARYVFLGGCRILDRRGRTNQHCHSENCEAKMLAELESGLRNAAALVMWMQSPSARAVFRRGLWFGI
jgi:hypothetical protein